MFRAPNLHGFDGPEVVVDPNIHFSPGTPAPPSVLRNVICIPWTNCLYDSSGARIAETCVFRGFRTGEDKNKSDGPERIEPDASWPVFDQPALYLQQIKWADWGHFLTEGIARFWAIESRPEFKNLKLLHNHFNIDAAVDGKIEQFLSHCEFERSRLIHFDSPAFLSEVIVPAPSFVLRRLAFEVHALYPEIVARKIVGPRTRERSERPVYVSRSHLPTVNRRITGEQKLEKILLAAGAEIVFPEELNLDEQTNLFASRSVFIGAEGSAFHNLLFSLPARVRSIVLTRPTFTENLILIDMIKKLDAHYINCLSMDESSRDEVVGKTRHRALDNILDLDRAVHFLKELGVLGPPRRRLGASEKPPIAQRIKHGIRKLLGRVLRRP